MTLASSNEETNIGTIKVLRLMKIFRLIRLLNLKALVQLEQMGRIPPSLIRLLKLLFIFFLLSHFGACCYWSFVLYTGFDENDPWVPAPQYEPQDGEPQHLLEQRRLEQYGQSICKFQDNPRRRFHPLRAPYLLNVVRCLMK